MIYNLDVIEMVMAITNWIIEITIMIELRFDLRNDAIPTYASHNPQLYVVVLLED